MEPCVPPRGMQQAIEIYEFHGVEINEGQPRDPGSCKGFGDDGPHAAGTNNPYVKPRQVVLRTLAPGRHRSPKFFLRMRRRHEVIRIGDAELFAYDPDIGAPPSFIRARCCLFPEPGAPRAIGAEREAHERQSRGALGCRGMRFLGTHVVVTHALPSRPQMAM